MTRPLVSVVVPAYNCEPYLVQAIRSVLDQDYEALEVVIVDDGSRDRTLDLANALAGDDPRVKVMTQANSGGAATPRNRAIAASKGALVAFLDPDDWWYAGKLSRQVEIFERHPDVDLVFEEADVVDEHGRVVGRFLGRVDYVRRAGKNLVAEGEHVFLGGPAFYAFSSAHVVGAQPSGVMVRRSALDRQPTLFATDLSAGEDIDLWFRLMVHGRVAYVDEPLHAYRQHSNSVMANLPRSSAGLAATHARNYRRGRELLSADDRRRYRRRIAHDFNVVGYQRWLLDDRAAARRACLESFLWWPNADSVVSFAKTLLPGFVVRAVRSRQAK